MNSYRAQKTENSSKPTRYYSKRQEKHIANNFSGRLTPNSGATPFSKGDVISGDGKGWDSWLYECKTCMTNKQSFSLKKEWFDKNKEESLMMKKEHQAVVFNFGPDTTNYVCIDENTFKEMLYELKNKEE